MKCLLMYGIYFKYSDRIKCGNIWSKSGKYKNTIKKLEQKMKTNS